MRAALSSLPCFSCFERSQQVDVYGGEDGRGDDNGASDLRSQPLGRPAELHTEGDGGVMSAGEVTVFPFAPSGSQEDHQPDPRTLTRLYCKNGGHHLRVSADGRVSGGRQDNDPYEILRLRAVSVGVVVIKGEHSGHYLAMDGEGTLYGAKTVSDECYFIEKYEENHYNTYRSQKFGWYVGIKKNGQPKPGQDTHLGQNAVLFLPRPV